jgi:signal transduction histidine kinase
MQFNRAGKQIKSEFVTPGAGARPLAGYTHSHPVSASLMGLFPWIGQHLVHRDDLPRLSVLQLPCGWGAGAMLVHEQQNVAAVSVSAPAQLEAMRHTWGAAIAAAAQHQGARRLAEQLASSNRQLVETQSALADHQSMARLGEMAAGAAHEMNNPLAIIAGRAQLLSQKLTFGSKEKADAELIWQQADRLSELITALRLFADPPDPKITKVNGADVLEDAVIMMKRRVPQAPAIRVTGIELAPLLSTDREHLASSIAELLINAVDAQPKTAVRVQASVDPLNDRLIILVKDDGVGMNAQTLEHAFDPFFSAKPAGRQVGLGLARARRLVESLGGEIELSSQPDRGCCARLAVPIRAIPRRETESEGANREVNSA